MARFLRGFFLVVRLLASAEEGGQLQLQLSSPLIGHLLFAHGDEDLADIEGRSHRHHRGEVCDKETFTRHLDGKQMDEVPVAVGMGEEA